MPVNVIKNEVVTVIIRLPKLHSQVVAQIYASPHWRTARTVCDSQLDIIIFYSIRSWNNMIQFSEIVCFLLISCCSVSWLHSIERVLFTLRGNSHHSLLSSIAEFRTSGWKSQANKNPFRELLLSKSSQSFCLIKKRWRKQIDTFFCTRRRRCNWMDYWDCSYFLE